MRHQKVVNKMSLNNATLGLKGGIAVIPFPTLESSLQHEGFFYLAKGGVKYWFNTAATVNNKADM